MVINISVQYNSGLLPDIIMLTHGYYHWGTRLNSMYYSSGFVFITYRYVIRSILLLPCVKVYYVVSVLFSMFFWCPCMAINNVNVQYNGGLLPYIILLTQ